MSMARLSSPQMPKVVFVDDEPMILDGIRRALIENDVDWDLVFFSDPQAALESEDILSCQVVVTDLLMPGMTGMELLSKLRMKYVGAQSIILTGTGDMNSAVEAINSLSVFRYYTKPCPSSLLIAGIDEAIATVSDRTVSASVADRLALAVIALDASKRIDFMNKEAATLVAAGEILCADVAGRCRAATTPQTVVLHQAVEHVALSGESLVLALTDAEREQRYSVLVEKDDGGRPGAVMLFVRDIDCFHIPSESALRTLFEFSGSEAKLARQLAAGLDLKQAAENLGLSVLTARTYLKTLFGKTGTNRQADLVRLLVTALPSLVSNRDDQSLDRQ